MRRPGTTPTVGYLRPVDERWKLAACRDNPDLHYPAGYAGRKTRVQVEVAREVCDRCPLTGLNGPCLAQAMEEEAGKALDQRHGIRAGTTPRERHDLEVARTAA